jgi:hypothetical protein
MPVRRLPSWAVWLLATATLSCVAASAQQSQVAFDLPTAGRLAAIATPLAARLREAGVAASAEGAAVAGTPVQAIVVYSGKEYAAGVLEGYVKSGGGLVYLFGTTERHAETAGKLARNLGLGLELERTAREALRSTEHPVAAGVEGLGSDSCDARLSGEVLQPVLLQGDAVVVGAAQVGKGRVVMIPASVVTAGARGDLSAGQVQLLAQACLWAANLGESQKPTPGTESLVQTGPQPAHPQTGGQPTSVPKPVQQAATPKTTTRPAPKSIEDTWPRPMKKVLARERSAPTAGFGGAALVDILAGDDNWDLIAGNLDAALTRVNLPVRYLDTSVETNPLIAALDSHPALLVIGSTRRFSIAEGIAVSNYVSLGGRVLFLAHASAGYPVRVIDFNTLLREFGFSASFIRPQAPSLLMKHAITEGLYSPPSAPAGLGLWSVEAEVVAKAGKVPFLSVLSFEKGRVVVLDAKTLLVGTKAVPSTVKLPDTLPFMPLFDRTLSWMLGP